MKLSELTRAYPPLSAQGHARFARTLHELNEEEPMKRKLSLSLALALALLLALAATGIALVSRYSVKEFISPRFADQVTEIDQQHENQWLELSINDAFSDGRGLSLALNLAHKKGADTVYVFPLLTAQSEGEQLDVDIEGGFDFFGGVWLPGMRENLEGAGRYSVDAAILEDILPGATGDIVWTLTFHVLRPNWPLQQDKHTQEGYLDRSGITHEAHAQLFRDAYREKTILISNIDTTLEFDAYLPVPEGVGEEEFMMMRQWERLVRSGAFDEVDRFSSSFTTAAGERLDAAPGLAAPTPPKAAYAISVTQATATRRSLEVRFDIAFTEPDHMQGFDDLTFKALAGDEELGFSAVSTSWPEEGVRRGPVSFVGLYNLDTLEGIPGEVRFVPVRVQYIPTQPGQNPIINRLEEPEHAFSIKLK